MSFIAEHIIEIIFGLISAGALAFCKYTCKEMENYKKLLEEQEAHKYEEMVTKKLEPVQKLLDSLTEEVHRDEALEEQHLSLLLASYRFRLVQLCKAYMKQGFITQNQYDQLSELFKYYHALGGNGQAQEYYDSAMKLEIRSEEDD